MCGIIGIVSYNGENVAPYQYVSLLSLQHRGQESAGMATFDGFRNHHKVEMGTVESVFHAETLKRLEGGRGVGHVRYSTAGGSTLANAQPIEGSFRGVPFWIAHNGNLVTYEKLWSETQARGYKFTSSCDTELIVGLISLSSASTFEEALLDALRKVRGTYALVVLYQNTVYGARDPSGNCPLLLGEGGGISVLASESTTFNILGIKIVRDIRAGEVIVLDEHKTSYIIAENEKRPCIFEYVYFARPDSMWEGRLVCSTRKEAGRILWRESPVKADVVIPVSDSGNFAALGVQEESGLPFDFGLLRSHYVGRTFIEPVEERRDLSLRIKHNPIPLLVAGKRCVVVDDSIVKASTSRKVVGMLREAGAQEIHLRVASPPYLFGCHYGKDTSRVEDKLIARNMGGNIDAIRREIGADTLAYLSMDGLRRAVAGSEVEIPSFCDACFTGNYHIPIQ